MSNWEASLEGSTEGKKIDDFMRKLNKLFGPSFWERQQELRDNVKMSVSVGNLEKVKDQKLLGRYVRELKDNGRTTVTVGDIAKQMAITYGFTNKQKHLLSQFSGVVPTQLIKNITQVKNTIYGLENDHNIFMDKSFGNVSLTTERLSKIEHVAIGANKLLTIAIKQIDVSMPRMNQIDPKSTYFKALEQLDTVVEDTHYDQYLGIHLVEQLEDMLERDDATPEIKKRIRQIQTSVNELSVNARTFTNLMHPVFIELQMTSILRESVYDTYVELKNMEKKMSKSNENMDWSASLDTAIERRTFKDWGSSLSPSVEAGALAKIKDKVAKLFGVGDAKRVEAFRKATGSKLNIEQLKSVKDKTISEKYYNLLKSQNKKTTTVGELGSFYLSVGLLKEPVNLQQSLMVASGRPSLPMFKKLPALMKQVDKFESNYTGMSVDQCITTMNKLISDMSDTYDAINKSAKPGKAVKAGDIKQNITCVELLKHHSDAVEIYWHTLPDTPFKLRKIIKTLKKQNKESVDKLDTVSKRFESIVDKLKTTGALSWTLTMDWVQITNLEIKMANIYDDITKGNQSAGNESRDDMTVDSIMSEWGSAIKGWQQGIEYKPGIEDDDKDMGEVSDGDHTFNELYMHRTTLFNIILCQNKDKAWKSKLHDDGTMFDNYFIAGVTTPDGEYTYHQHMDYWDKFDVEERERAPEWDGHKPDDITRLYSLLK